MNARKIDAMHILYGTGEGSCSDCQFFMEGYYHDRKLFKCSVYGVTHSEATDWRKSYLACGLKHSARPDERPVIDRLRGQKTYVNEQIEGQISMDEILNGREVTYGA